MCYFLFGSLDRTGSSIRHPSGSFADLGCDLLGSMFMRIYILARCQIGSSINSRRGETLYLALSLMGLSSSISRPLPKRKTFQKHLPTDYKLHELKS